MSKDNSNNGGIGFVSLLTISFIVLKLCGVINWSWIWVISPMWILITVLGIGVLILYIVKD